jgi:hypothetical protein
VCEIGEIYWPGAGSAAIVVGVVEVVAVVAVEAVVSEAGWVVVVAVAVWQEGVLAGVAQIHSGHWTTCYLEQRDRVEEMERNDGRDRN